MTTYLEERLHWYDNNYRAGNEMALKILNWYPKNSLNDMCKDGWKWKINNPDGYI